MSGDCWQSRRRILENTVIVVVVCIVLFGVASLPFFLPDKFDTVPGPDKTESLPHHYAVSSSDDYTTNYGYDILMKGGNVFDAMVGMQALLTLTEPMSSGWGGGCQIVVRKADGSVFAIDGSSEAPADTVGDEIPNYGGAASGVPGCMHAMMSAHEKYGTKTAKTLFDPVIERARGAGWLVDEWSAHQFLNRRDHIARFPATADIYLHDGEYPYTMGETVTNPGYAHFLETILKEGWRSFYNGSIADKIVEAVRNDPVQPGVMTKADLAGYRSVERSPVNTTWNGFNVYSIPGGGSSTLFLTLHMIEHILAELSGTQVPQVPSEEDTWAGKHIPGQEPTDSSVPTPPTETPAPPTETPAAPTETPAPPTETPAPPTETPAPPTETPAPPTETPVPPTETPAPPTEPATPPTEPTSPGNALGIDGMAPGLETAPGQNRKRYQPFAHGETVESITYLLNALNVAFADRDEWVADPDWEDVPFSGILDRDYAGRRSSLVKPHKVVDLVPSGSPPGSTHTIGHVERKENTHGGTHFTITDGYGNVAVVTSTIEQAFGSGVVVPGYGFLLNSELVDFSKAGRNKLEGGKKLRRTALPPENKYLGGKRPRTATTPLILVKDNKPALALGSPGGTSIPGVLANVLTNVYYREKTLAQAVFEPRYVSQNNGTWLFESAFFSESHLSTMLDELKELGADTGVFVGDSTGAVAAIKFMEDGSLEAIADPRKGYATAKVSAGFAYPEASWIVKHK